MWHAGARVDSLTLCVGSTCSSPLQQPHTVQCPGKLESALLCERCVGRGGGCQLSIEILGGTKSTKPAGEELSLCTSWRGSLLPEKVVRGLGARHEVSGIVSNSLLSPAALSLRPARSFRQGCAKMSQLLVLSPLCRVQGPCFQRR